MRNPSGTAVGDACGLFTVFRNHPDEIKERFDQFGEIANLRKPVVHLNVDVDVIIRTPRSFVVLAPDPLQVGGQFAARRTDEEVPSEIEVQLDQTEVVFRFGKTAVGRNIGFFTRSGERDAGTSEHGRKVVPGIRKKDIVSGRHCMVKRFPTDIQGIPVGFICRRGSNIDVQSIVQKFMTDEDRVFQRQISHGNDFIVIIYDGSILTFVAELHILRTSGHPDHGSVVMVRNKIIPFYSIIRYFRTSFVQPQFTAVA